jgi:hypothetical protein
MGDPLRYSRNEIMNVLYIIYYIYISSRRESSNSCGKKANIFFNYEQNRKVSVLIIYDRFTSVYILYIICYILYFKSL